VVRDALALIRNLQVRLVPIDHLFPYIRNSRTHTDAQVALYLPFRVLDVRRSLSA